jgi:hypothetical protein
VIGSFDAPIDLVVDKIIQKTSAPSDASGSLFKPDVKAYT